MIATAGLHLVAADANALALACRAAMDDSTLLDDVVKTRSDNDDDDDDDNENIMVI
jgi:hypothetical protein